MLETILGVKESASETCLAYACRQCGYGISVVRARALLPHCPMCRVRSWAPEPWRRSPLRTDIA
jgi:hypothetical protein